MTTYKLLKNGVVLRNGKDSIPPDTENTDYLEYLIWVSQGNEPEPADIPD